MFDVIQLIYLKACKHKTKEFSVMYLFLANIQIIHHPLLSFEEDQYCYSNNKPSILEKYDSILISYDIAYVLNH